MNSKENESQKRSKTAPDSVEILDFFYIDRGRVSNLYAQLFPQGTLTNVKTTSQIGSLDERQMGGDLKVFKLEGKSSESSSEGVEHTFDASAAVPLEVLSGLLRHGFLKSLSDPGVSVGSIIREEVWVRIVDYSMMKSLWRPGIDLFWKSSPEGSELSEENKKNWADLFLGLPHTLHAHFLPLRIPFFLWSSLSADGLQLPSDDLTLKYGGSVYGKWTLVSVIDALPSDAEPPNFDSWSGGDITNGVLMMMHALLQALGRHAQWMGVTPLMIYRKLNTPYFPSPE